MVIVLVCLPIRKVYSGIQHVTSGVPTYAFVLRGVAEVKSKAIKTELPETNLLSFA